LLRIFDRPIVEKALNMKKILCGIVLTAAFALPGCTTIYSELRGEFDMPTTALNDYPVRIIAIDGAFQTEQDPRIEPGLHSLVLASRKPSQFRVKREKAFPLAVEPCTRYFLAARHATALSEDWELVIRKREPIGGCNVDAARKAALG
jgi:hypothetical protein